MNIVSMIYVLNNTYLMIQDFFIVIQIIVDSFSLFLIILIFYIAFRV